LGEVIASRPEGALGLATFDLPPGQGRLDVRLAPTPAQRWGSVLSLLACLALGVALMARIQRSLPRRAWRSMLLCASYLLLAAVLMAGLLWPNGYVQALTPVGANLGDTAQVLAYATDEARYQPGDTILVTLYWRALRLPDRDYKAFVHLVDAGMTRQPAQHDGDPNGGFSPTTRWLPGEIVPDSHRLDLPGDLAPGLYRLWAGMYDYETVQNLEVVSSGTTAVDGRILLGEVEVVVP
jgi:hypothetical protein